MSIEEARQTKTLERYGAYNEAMGSIIPSNIGGIGNINFLYQEISSENEATPYIDGLVFAGRDRSDLMSLKPSIDQYLFKVSALDAQSYDLGQQIEAATTEDEVNAITVDFSDILNAVYPAV